MEVAAERLAPPQQPATARTARRCWEIRALVVGALHYGTMQPSDDLIAYTRRIGYMVATQCGQLWMSEDIASEAVACLLAEWPIIVERYGPTPPTRLVATVVTRRLTDWLRTEFGRYHRKPHADAVVLLDPEGNTIDLPDPNDAFDGAGEIDLGLEELIDLVLMAVSDDQRPTMEIVCRALAGGQTLAEIGDILGVTESRASKLVTELGDRAQGHAFVRSALAA